MENDPEYDTPTALLYDLLLKILLERPDDGWSAIESVVSSVRNLTAVQKLVRPKENGDEYLH